MYLVCTLVVEERLDVSLLGYIFSHTQTDILVYRREGGFKNFKRKKSSYFLLSRLLADKYPVVLSTY